MRFLVAACFIQFVFLFALALAIGGTLKEVRQCATVGYLTASFEPRDRVLLEAARKLNIPVEVATGEKK